MHHLRHLQYLERLRQKEPPSTASRKQSSVSAKRSSPPQPPTYRVAHHRITSNKQSLPSTTSGASSVQSSAHSIASGTKTAASATFARRYIDNNLYSLRHHANTTNTTNTTFPTEAGLNISAAIHTTRERLKLDEFRGCAPQPFYVNRAPYPSNTSIFTWLQTSVLPEHLNRSRRSSHDGVKALALTNLQHLKHLRRPKPPLRSL